jgi:hypothetical protein
MNNLALWYRRFGEPASVLQPEITAPGALKPGELRVRMHYSPVNASDLIPITGAYRHRTPLPAVAGYEGVGEVTEAPARSRIFWASACYRCGGKAPGNSMLIARRNMQSRYRTRFTRTLPRGHTLTRWPPG